MTILKFNYKIFQITVRWKATTNPPSFFFKCILDFGEVSNGFIFFGELLPKSDSSKNVVKWLLFIFYIYFKK